jgi:hypothetical protein
LARQALAASFDCRRASARVEVLICSDPTLSALDDQLDASYKAADAGRALPALHEEQRTWLAQRARCGDAACLADLYRRRIADLSASVGAPPPAADAGSPAGPAGGRYCVFGSGNSYDMLLAQPNRDGSLAFGLTSWTADGSNFAVAGTARPSGRGWRYEENMTSPDPDQRCAVVFDRTPDGGFQVATVEGARCEADAGHGAVLYGTDIFPAASRAGDAPQSFTGETLMQIGCERPRTGRHRGP